jgi:hypothetical protein
MVSRLVERAGQRMILQRMMRMISSHKEFIGNHAGGGQSAACGNQ